MKTAVKLFCLWFVASLVVVFFAAIAVEWHFEQLKLDEYHAFLANEQSPAMTAQRTKDREDSIGRAVWWGQLRNQYLAVVDAAIRHAKAGHANYIDFAIIDEFNTDNPADKSSDEAKAATWTGRLSAITAAPQP
jgi:hypothetical protein